MNKSKNYYSLRSEFFLNILQNWLVSYRITDTTIDILVEAKYLDSILIILKNFRSINTNMLVELTAVDLFSFNQQEEEVNNKNRYKLIYSLMSISNNFRVNIHTFVPKKNNVYYINTVTDHFLNAGWLEREVWDFFGITFLNNKDLRRILLDYNFKGFPLRKDFPVIGYSELFYFDGESRVVYLPVTLIQEQKQFSWQPRW